MTSLVLDFNLESKQLRLFEHEIDLPPQPFDFLAALAADPGRVLSQEELMRRVWGAGAAHVRDAMHLFRAAASARVAIRDLLRREPELQARLGTVLGLADDPDIKDRASTLARLLIRVKCRVGYRLHLSPEQVRRG